MRFVVAAAAGIFGAAVLAAVTVVSGLGAVPVATITTHHAVPIVEQQPVAPAVAAAPAPALAVAGAAPSPVPAAAAAVAAVAPATITVSASAPKHTAKPRRPAPRSEDHQGQGDNNLD